jgi:hypothetical protein
MATVKGNHLSTAVTYAVDGGFAAAVARDYRVSQTKERRCALRDRSCWEGFGEFYRTDVRDAKKRLYGDMRAFGSFLLYAAGFIVNCSDYSSD